MKRWRINLCVVAVGYALCLIGGVVDAASPPDDGVDPNLIKAHELEAAGNFLEAREFLLNHIAGYAEGAPQGIMRELWNLNVRIIQSPVETHQTELYVVQKGDTLDKIAKNFGTTIELIKLRNKMTSDVIHPGQKVSIWLASLSIIIDKSDNTLMLKNGDHTVKIYDVSTGKNDSTPVGSFTIMHRFVDPVWFHKGDVVPGGDPKNFLGTRWLGFDKPKYGIHGTIEPQFIGKAVSSGCIRMRNEDVQELYDLIPTGTKVVIHE